MPAMRASALEAAEFNLVDQISKLPAAAKRKRDQALKVLAKLRDVKSRLLARNPNLLLKGSAVALKLEPSWRGLPVDNIAADILVKEARSRAAEEQRLAKRAGEETPQPAIDVLKRALRAPTATGNRCLVSFLTGRAGR
jgi:hypothetical protein